jgi:hypothetical protein
MKNIFTILLSGIICLSMTSLAAYKTDISTGEQPQVTVDNKGTIRVVFGQQENIFCAVSNDNGVPFSKPGLVAQEACMHLGMSRGPQIAASANYQVIATMDKTGKHPMV